MIHIFIKIIILIKKINIILEMINLIINILINIMKFQTLIQKNIIIIKNITFKNVYYFFIKDKIKKIIKPIN